MGYVRTESVQWLQDIEFAAVLFTNQMQPHSMARNHIVEEFLKTGCDALLMVDHDTIPPAGTVQRLSLLLEQGASVATGITPILKNGATYYNVYRDYIDVERGTRTYPNRPFQIVGCGASCMMISRKILEKLPKPWFMALEFPEGKLCSEDLYFCDQVGKAGGSIVCDPKVMCKHAKEVLL